MVVLEHIVKGLCNKEISARMGITIRTVKFHVSNALEKIGAVDRTQAVIVAVQRGIVHLDD